MNYLAPEVIDCKPATFKSDIWSTFVVIYTLCQHRFPFDGDNYLKVRKQINNIKLSYQFSQRNWNHVSKDGKEFLWKGLQVNPASRPTAAQALKHQWLKKKKDAPLLKMNRILIN